MFDEAQQLDEQELLGNFARLIGACALKHHEEICLNEKKEVVPCTQEERELCARFISSDYVTELSFQSSINNLNDGNHFAFLRPQLKKIMKVIAENGSEKLLLFLVDKGFGRELVKMVYATGNKRLFAEVMIREHAFLKLPDKEKVKIRQEGLDEIIEFIYNAIRQENSFYKKEIFKS